MPPDERQTNRTRRQPPVRSGQEHTRRLTVSEIFAALGAAVSRVEAEVEFRSVKQAMTLTAIYEDVLP